LLPQPTAADERTPALGPREREERTLVPGEGAGAQRDPVASHGRGRERPRRRLLELRSAWGTIQLRDAGRLPPFVQPVGHLLQIREQGIGLPAFLQQSRCQIAGYR